ncbi:MAG: SMC-Scp complex subunit ScpB [Thermoleophilia bacterium]
MDEQEEPMNEEVSIAAETEPAVGGETDVALRADDAATAAIEPQPEPEPEPQPDLADLVRDIEAILFISPEPVSLEVLAEVTGGAGEELAYAVEAVRAKYSDPACGIAFAEVAGGYTFRSSDTAQAAVERFCARPVDYSLSAAAMETLAIIAYLQPITRPEVARIRGVGADTVVANLMDKGLVEEAGRHQQTGALKYRTTSVFEKLFGLADLTGLPHLDGFEATTQDVEELRAKLYTAAEKRQ